MHTITLEARMTTPAYFHTLTADELAVVIEQARDVIFGNSDDVAKKAAGVRLYYARITQGA